MMDDKFDDILNREILDRLLHGLEKRDIPKRGRVIKLSKVLGYSKGRISDLLSGKVPLGDRFIKSTCAAYQLNPEWVLTGQGAMFGASVDTAWKIESPSISAEDYNSLLKDLDVAILEAIREIKKLPEADRWALVADLKRKK